MGDKNVNDAREMFVPHKENTQGDQHLTTKEELIQFGLKYLEGIGSPSICQVCILHGGSCCTGCSHLKQGVGCQQRNISCTAWLCGFLKFIFHETGLLSEWDSFWEQIPGKDFRKDSTPPVVVINKWLETPSVQLLGEAFAKDLSKLIMESNQFDYVIRLHADLDFYLDRLNYYKSPEALVILETGLKDLTKDFHYFHSAKEKMNI
ncbi:hypothetical protein [Baia soyae]|uniref:DNA mismatch repair protein n=1 Tax=Baia soyae TaxID=1544746 RepID=A0A4R2RF21_9BACL|nr:hypothetical protein [Baia soyae]TCP62152.1 hypothetical protein EDD57_15615 [Baia soyae]